MRLSIFLCEDDSPLTTPIDSHFTVMPIKNPKQAASLPLRTVKDLKPPGKAKKPLELTYLPNVWNQSKSKTREFILANSKHSSKNTAEFSNGAEPEIETDLPVKKFRAKPYSKQKAAQKSFVITCKKYETKQTKEVNAHRERVKYEQERLEQRNNKIARCTACRMILHRMSNHSDEECRRALIQSK